MNVLITSGVSAFSQRAAKLFPDSDNLFFTDSNPIPTTFLNTGKYKAIPSSEKASFVHEVLKLCLDLSIHQLLPLRLEEFIPLTKSRLLFEEYGIFILLPNLESLPDIPKFMNPTRSNCPEIILKQPISNEQGSFGIFKKDEHGSLSLCCLE